MAVFGLSPRVNGPAVSVLTLRTGVYWWWQVIHAVRYTSALNKHTWLCITGFRIYALCRTERHLGGYIGWCGVVVVQYGYGSG